MSTIVFARTRHEYFPYQDFWRLVQLAGFPVSYLDEIDWKARQTVVATPKNGEWAGVPPKHASRLIWWNLERMHTDCPPEDMSHPAVPPGVDEVWASDRAMATAHGARYVFLGGHRAFGSVDIRHKRYDYITLMYWSGRRQQIRGDFQGLSCGDGPQGTWGADRHVRLMESKLMVSAHQDEMPWSEPIRWAIAGMYALPLLTETSRDPGHWHEQTHFLSADLRDLGNLTHMVLHEDAIRARLSAAAWRLVCVERPFRESVLEAAS